MLPCSALGKAAKSELLEVAVKLRSQVGCWHYFGDASVYVGTFKEGTYIGVSMVTIGPQGFPEPSDKEERTPVLDAPEFKGGVSAQRWFGPMPATKEYKIRYSPLASIGTSALVVVCAQSVPPVPLR
jgi:hypothetical protein